MIRVLGTLIVAGLAAYKVYEELESEQKKEKKGDCSEDGQSTCQPRTKEKGSQKRKRYVNNEIKEKAIKEFDRQKQLKINGLREDMKEVQQELSRLHEIKVTSDTLTVAGKMAPLGITLENGMTLEEALTYYEDALNHLGNQIKLVTNTSL